MFRTTIKMFQNYDALPVIDFGKTKGCFWKTPKQLIHCRHLLSLYAIILVPCFYVEWTVFLNLFLFK